MWKSWWTSPLPAVVIGSYHSAPTPTIRASVLIGWPSSSSRLLAVSQSEPQVTSPDGPIGHPPSDDVPAAPPPEIAEFIRFCHRRRPRAWPDLYDEMWVVAARREFNGWGFEQLEAYGVTFSLFEMPRLAAWVREVVAATPDLPEPVLVGPVGA